MVDIYRPRYAIVHTGDILSGVLPVQGGGTAMFVDHRDGDTGTIHREIRPVSDDTPHFILPGVGQVDEGELAELAAFAREEGARLVRESEERRGYVKPTKRMYQNKLAELWEKRKLLAEGSSVSGPNWSREGSSHPWL